MYHAAVYGYFQHAYEVWYALQENNIEHFSQSDLALQRQKFDSIRSRIRGTNTYNTPSPINGIAAMLGAGNNYPKTIRISSADRIFYDQITELKFSKLLSLYKKYCKLTQTPMCEQPFSELMSNLRTAKAIDFLMKKFRIESVD